MLGGSQIGAGHQSRVTGIKADATATLFLLPSQPLDRHHSLLILKDEETHSTVFMTGSVLALDPQSCENAELRRENVNSESSIM